MTDTIALTGIVATTPRHLVTSSGLAITSFRLACRQRRFDRVKNAWVDADTNWYTVSSFRQLAHNVEQSVHKGEPVLVTGRLRIRDWENEDRSGTSVEVEADAVGHNLSWGTTALVRSIAPSAVEQRDADPAGGAAGEAAGQSDSAHAEPDTSQGESETQSA
ncbi:single-stranded DNA-binding protein [Cryobacterium adonitolivorans]|uniref:Single-stranded DNA-binding protein n=1 Tax=Cryobacterium adonitolivorans TaxID=1259189 RepID=A0A4R8W483_9MICO|nr:single-stranded DNA-binding protein [Cryobacterium adonitolivorans]TFC01386.1 single-stranded DNA-binding protein [Cryobacterium adonitolivorans]